MLRKNANSKKGSALVIVLVVILVLGLIGAYLVQKGKGTQRLASSNKNKIQAYYDAETGINRAILRLMREYNPQGSTPGAMASNFRLEPGPVEFELLPLEFPDETQILDGPIYRFKFTDPEKGEITYQIFESGVETAPDHQPLGWIQIGPEAQKEYVIQAVSVNPKSGAREGIEKRILVTRRALSTYGHFSDVDLEFHPGQEMIEDGDVHTNGNLFLSTGGVGRLLFKRNVTAAGHIFYGQKYGLDQGPVFIMDKDVGGTEVPMTAGTDSILTFAGFLSQQLSDSSFPQGSTWDIDSNWLETTKSLWNDRVQDSAHGITPLVVPSAAETDPSGYFGQEADIRISIDATGTANIERKNGAPIAGCGLNVLTENGVGFYEGREQKTVKTTDIDLDRLTQNSPCYPPNGLLFISREDAVMDSNPYDFAPDPASQPNGIRLVNSNTLHKPLVLVTNNPLYIKGNLNTQGDPSCPMVLGQRTCALGLIGDAVTVLSNAWDDAANAGPVPQGRTPSATEINAAIVTGVRRSGYDAGGTFHNGGGTENTFRLLENWDNGGNQIELKYRGSLNVLWESRYATSDWRVTWGSNSYYTVPKRNLGYDDRYYNLPRLNSPAFVNIFPATRSAELETKGGFRMISELTFASPPVAGNGPVMGN